MKRIVSVLCLFLMLCVFSTAVIVNADETGAEPTVEELQKQIEELQKENEELRKENEELKTKLGEEPVAEAPVELAADVASADTTVEYTDIATVQLVQIALNEAGYNCGTADGKAGTKTHEQVTAYQTANGLTVNGLITEQVIVSLGLGDKVAEAAKAEAEKASYSTEYSYDQLARTPDTYEGKKVKFSGKVLQAQEDTESDFGVIILTIDSSYNNVYVAYKLSNLDFRVLDGDQITIYGVAHGMYSYETVRGNTLTIPLLYADYIELN